MKKTSGIVCLIMGLVLFNSCEVDDDPSGPEINSEILGKWYPVEAVVEGVVFPYDDHEECGKDYIEFSNDGRVKEVDVWNCEEDIDGSGTYEVNENILSVKYGGSESIEMEIAELTATTLILVMKEDHNDNGNLEEVRARYSRE